MKVKKGKHGFKPYRFRLEWKPQAISFGVVFGEGAKYDLGNQDQYDWNKGGGISFDLLTNHRRSAMWAWRYNIFTNTFEFTPYVHDRELIVKGDNLQYRGTAIKGKPIFEAAPGEPLNITIRFWGNNRIVYFFHSSTDSAVIEIKARIYRKLGRRIGAWFGGNNPAPQDLDFIEYQKTFQ